MADLNGIAVVYKEKGYTSHDVVSVMRKILQTSKIGHTGTLDPNAEGVLPVCVGKSTKLADMLTFSDKEYVAKVKLGLETDTYDIWGDVTGESEHIVKKDELLSAIGKYTGEIEQLPPMYSAIKINGKKLYELARKGIEVERKPRKVTIYDCELLSFDGSEFEIRVSCSKGTYIRSLCHDIGKTLGCGACMTSLIRTKSSVFDLKSAKTLDEIRALVEKNGAASVLMPPDSVFEDYPKINVTEAVKKRLLNGALSRIEAPLGKYRAYAPNGEFVGITEIFVGEKGNIIKIVKAFCEQV